MDSRVAQLKRTTGSRSCSLAESTCSDTVSYISTEPSSISCTACHLSAVCHLFIRHFYKQAHILSLPETHLNSSADLFFHVQWDKKKTVPIRGCFILFSTVRCRTLQGKRKT